MSSLWPNSIISPQGLVQEVTRSPEPKGDPEGESVITLDVDNATSCAMSKSKALATSTFYGKKTGMKKGYPSSEIKRKNSREVQWVKLGKSSISKFDREETDGGSRLNDQHINYAQAMIKS